MSTHQSFQDGIVRGVVRSAREIRIRFHDARELYGTVVIEDSMDPACFALRPWGLPLPLHIPFRDVSRAAPVQHMSWARHRTISKEQADASAAASSARDGEQV